MSELVLIVKMTLVAAIGLSATMLARRARASLRHAILASTFVALLLLPLATSLLPAITLEVPVASTPIAATFASSQHARVAMAGTPQESGRADEPAVADRWVPAWPSVVRGLWAAGTLALLISLGIRLWQFRRLRRHGLPWTDITPMVEELRTAARIRRVNVLLHDDLATPAMSGWRHVSVLLPSDARHWSDAKTRNALIHEFEHLRRGDWGTHLMARVTCAIFWFHPLVWLAFGRLCLEAERACDDAVLQAAERADYAEQLVQLARQMSETRVQPLLAMATRSDLATRVTAILDHTQSRGRLGRTPIAATIGAAAILVATLAPLRAVAVTETPVASSQRTVVAALRSAVSATNDAAGSTQDRRRERPRGSGTALDHALLEAAADGDIDAMSRLLDAGAKVNGAVPGDGSPLIAAAREGHADAVAFLLDRGGDPNLAVRGDGNALIMAAQAGHLDVVDLLLTRGANIEQVVEDDENALITASAAGQVEMVTLLVSQGANVNARVWAAGAGRSRDSRTRGGEWRTPLSMALRGRHDAVANYLRSAGARDNP